MNTANVFTSRLFATMILCALCAVVLVSAPKFVGAQTPPPSTIPVAGWGWSSFIGWISFSGTAANGSPYGVSEHVTTGALSGYAWSSNIGWISFNASDVVGCPLGGVCAPKVDLTTGKLSGWLRACGAFANKNACSGALDARSGGWDGWISLSGTTTSGSAYGVTQTVTTTGTSTRQYEWTGFAWGSDTVGAISMSGNATGNFPYSVTINAPVAPVSVTLSADKTSVVLGESVTLTWLSMGATSCTSSGFATGGLLSGNTDVTPTANTTYSITCTGPGGTSSATSTPATTVTATSSVVITIAPPTVTLTASKNVIDVGETVTLTWVSENATSCTSSGFTTGGLLSGNTDVTPSSRTTYSITCTGPGGSSTSTTAPSTVTDSVVVTIISSSVSFSALPNRVAKNGIVTVTWNIANVNSCTVTKNGTPWKALTANASRAVVGSDTTTIASQTAFVITCTNNVSTAPPVTATRIVKVAPSFQDF